MKTSQTNRLASFPLLLGLLGTSLLLLASRGHAADEAFTLKANVPYVIRGSDETLKMNLYVPEDEGPHPTVLLVHGGAWKMGNPWHMHSVAQQLATRGYTAASIAYRLAPAHRFPAQLEDCVDAVRFLRKNATKYKVDPERIAGFGYSAGGHLVSLLGACEDGQAFPFISASATKPSARLQAVVAGGAPCDFTTIDENQRMLAYWLGDTRKNIPHIYEKASPQAFVSATDPPMFFYHGDQDRLVPIQSAKRMSAALKRVGVKTSVHAIPRTGHLGASRDPESMEKAIRFLDDVLKKKNRDPADVGQSQ